MCVLCELKRETYADCPQCSRMMCFDAGEGGDTLRRAVTTEDGDVMCDLCAVELSRAEFQEEEREAIGWPEFDPYEKEGDR